MIKKKVAFIGRAFDDNWGLDDPTGKSDEEFKSIIKKIEKRVFELKERIFNLKNGILLRELPLNILMVPLKYAII